MDVSDLKNKINDQGVQLSNQQALIGRE